MQYLVLLGDSSISTADLKAVYPRLVEAFNFAIEKGQIYAVTPNGVQLIKTKTKKDAETAMEIAEYEFPGDSYLEDGPETTYAHHHQGTSLRQSRIKSGAAIVKPRSMMTRDEQMNDFIYTLAESAPSFYERERELYNDEEYDHSHVSKHCDCEQSSFWVPDNDSRQSGLVYSGSNIKVVSGDLPPGVYGQVDLASRPFEITIARNITMPRALMSVAHEGVHLMDNIYKLGLSHERVHDLGVYLATEIIPAYNALAKTAGSKP